MVSWRDASMKSWWCQHWMNWFTTFATCANSSCCPPPVSSSHSATSLPHCRRRQRRPCFYLTDCFLPDNRNFTLLKWPCRLLWIMNWLINVTIKCTYLVIWISILFLPSVDAVNRYDLHHNVRLELRVAFLDYVASLRERTAILFIWRPLTVSFSTSLFASIPSWTFL